MQKHPLFKPVVEPENEKTWLKFKPMGRMPEVDEKDPVIRKTARRYHAEI